MASGSAGRPNSAPKAFDFGSDDILCSYEDYANKDSSNGSHSDPVTNSSKQDFHKGRMSSVFPASAYGQAEDSIKQDVISTVENSMKKHSDNLLRFLEGISSRLSQLELYCYNLDKSVGEMRSELARDHEESDSKLKSIEKHLQEVHRSVQIIRDKQELAETQKDLAKLQVSQKEPSSSSHPQSNEERASSAASDPKKNENASEIHNQQLALALPHQIVPQQNPITPPSAALPQNVPQQQQSYYISSTQLPGQPPHIQQHAQGQYISSDSQHRAPQPQDVSSLPPQMTNPQLSQAPPLQQFNQYQQQWTQQPSQQAQPPQQPSMQPQIRPPPSSVYPSYPPSQPTSVPETLSSSMPMQMSFASIPQPGSSRVDTVPYGYAPSGGSAPQQPPQVKNAFGPAAGEGYMPPPGQQSALSSGGAYMMYDRESGRSPHHPPQQPPHHPPQQPHFNQSGYSPANPSLQMPQAPTGPHVSSRNPSHSHLIEKLVGMGFRGDHVASVIQRMEDSGQPVDFNAVLDRLSASAGPGPQRAW
ncbi:basic salivary proline-rich protein 2-like [Momordica charantia]|uniref:Basic salivary proline-rich protein 2-like n=1 Tax=Momordica charantia TaxID=3673 RepID=A0A6J1D3H2_MOMCH|nr:basic salivary proline-rich protein 2-like [Momordica charantia]